MDLDRDRQIDMNRLVDDDRQTDNLRWLDCWKLAGRYMDSLKDRLTDWQIATEREAGNRSTDG